MSDYQRIKLFSLNRDFLFDYLCANCIFVIVNTTKQHNNERETDMTNAQINKFAASLNKRHDEEKKNNKASASLRLIEKCTLVVSQKAVCDLLERCEVSADFAHDKKQADDKFDMKALENVADVLKFVTDQAKIDELKSCVEECIRTLVLFKKNDVANIRLADFEAALDSNVKIAKEKQHLYFRRKKAFSSAKRHATMNMRALAAINAVKQLSRDTYAINDNEITQKLVAAFA
jgi:hypothetical protein